MPSPHHERKLKPPLLPNQHHETKLTYPPPSSPPPPEEDFLNNGTVPDHGIAFQAFSEKEYGGEATEIYTTEGYHDLPFNAISYVWIPNNSECCIAFCQDKKNTTSFWCDERFREESSEDGFPRLGVICGLALDPKGKQQRCVEKKDDE